MRRKSRIVFVLVAASWATADTSSAQVAGQPAAAPAQAQTPAARPAAPAAAPDPARMKQLLQVWEQRSARLKTLDVKIRRLDRAPAWGDETYEGRAILKNPNLVWLDFKKVSKDKEGKSVLLPYERIICTGNEVWQYRSDTKQIFIFPLDKQDQKRALEEGPLPFLFNMKAAEAEARYLMSLVTETPDYYVISILPKLKIDRESFLKAFLKLNKKNYLPDRIFLVSPDGQSTKDFVLTEVRPDAAVADQNFKGQILGPPWTVVRDTGVAAADRAAVPAAAGNRPAAAVGNRPAAPPASAAPRRR